MDLTPGYRELPPPAGLREVVACLWIRVCETGHEVRVVPDACTDVIWRQGEGTTVAGPDTQAKLVGFLDAVYEARPEAANLLRKLGEYVPADGRIPVSGGTEDETLKPLDIAPRPDRPARELLDPEAVSPDGSLVVRIDWAAKGKQGGVRIDQLETREEALDAAGLSE